MRVQGDLPEAVGRKEEQNTVDLSLVLLVQRGAMRQQDNMTRCKDPVVPLLYSYLKMTGAAQANAETMLIRSR
jgi:hypothetical protein